MKAARLIFAIAGIYGLIVLLPLFFVEPRLVPRAEPARKIITASSARRR